MERKVLQMIFLDELGKSATVSVANPKEDLNMETVRPVGELIAQKPVLESTKSALVTFKNARIVTTTINELV